MRAREMKDILYFMLNVTHLNRFAFKLLIMNENIFKTAW